MAQNLAIEGDPRLHEKEREIIDSVKAASSGDSRRVGGIRPQHRKLHDPSVTFEEYHYYAKLTRAEEDNASRAETGILSIIFPSKNSRSMELKTEHVSQDASLLNTSNHAIRLTITDEEWTNASRAYRTASVGACK